MRNVLTVVMLFFMASSAKGVIISADADGYSGGANISTAFAGMTLSSVGSASGLDGFVYAYDDVAASTGTGVFGHNLPDHTKWYHDAWPSSNHPEDFALRADFDEPADWVSIDIICDDIYDYAMLWAYNSDGLLVDFIWTEPPLTPVEVVTATISRQAFDISYIIAGGTFANSESFVYLDNLTANIIPEPATVLMFGLGGLVLRKKHKR